MFSERFCSFVVSLIKIIVVSKKTQCDLEVYVLPVRTLEGAADGNRQCLGQSTPDGECPGAAQVDGYLPCHLNAHGATDLVLKKKKKRKRDCDPKCLTSLTCLT